jgi:hypothetical protein
VARIVANALDAAAGPDWNADTDFDVRLQDVPLTNRRPDVVVYCADTIDITPGQTRADSPEGRDVLGRILDPFVDKIIIGGTLIFLTKLPERGVTPWITFIVIGREMFITGLRSVVVGHGVDFSAQWSGKIKMTLQSTAIRCSCMS